MAFFFQGLWLLAHGPVLTKAGYRILGPTATVLGVLGVVGALGSWVWFLVGGSNPFTLGVPQLLGNLVLLWADILAIAWLREG